MPRRLVVPLLLLSACEAGESSSSTPPSVPAPRATTEPPEVVAPVERPDGGAAPEAFSVLALNLHCLDTGGTIYATNADRFAAIAATARDASVDVILAQEVCEKPEERTREALSAALEGATGAAWSSASAFAHRAWEDTPAEADEHVAIFARGALTDPRETVHRPTGALRRVALGATVEAPLDGAPARVRVMTVHLDHRDAVVRAAQAREVATAATLEATVEAVASADGVALPVVVGGDFNARAASEALASMAAAGFVDASHTEGSRRIDHVLVHRSAPLEPVAREVLFTGQEAVSDHPGVLVRFAARAASPVRLTRIVASIPATTALTARGGVAPLDWEYGWPLLPSPDGQVFVTSEVPAGAFEYKLLRGDVDWQLGDNAIGQGQQSNAVTPAFP